MTNLGWGGGDGRPEKKTCPECGKTARGLKQHRRDAHGAAAQVREPRVGDRVKWQSLDDSIRPTFGIISELNGNRAKITWRDGDTTYHDLSDRASCVRLVPHVETRDVNGAALAVGDKVRRTDATIVREVLAVAGEDMGPGFRGFVMVSGVLGWAHGKRFEKVI